MNIFPSWTFLVSFPLVLFGSGWLKSHKHYQPVQEMLKWFTISSLISRLTVNGAIIFCNWLTIQVISQTRMPMVCCFQLLKLAAFPVLYRWKPSERFQLKFFLSTKLCLHPPFSPKTNCVHPWGLARTDPFPSQLTCAFFERLAGLVHEILIRPTLKNISVVLQLVKMQLGSCRFWTFGRNKQFEVEP